MQMNEPSPIGGLVGHLEMDAHTPSSACDVAPLHGQYRGRILVFRSRTGICLRDDSAVMRWPTCPEGLEPPTRWLRVGRESALAMPERAILRGAHVNL